MLSKVKKITSILLASRQEKTRLRYNAVIARRKKQSSARKELIRIVLNSSEVNVIIFFEALKEMTMLRNQLAHEGIDAAIVFDKHFTAYENSTILVRDDIYVASNTMPAGNIIIVLYSEEVFPEKFLEKLPHDSPVRLHRI